MKQFRDLSYVKVTRKNVNSKILLDQIEDYVYDILKTTDGRTFETDTHREILQSYLNDSMIDHQKNGLIENFKVSFDYTNKKEPYILTIKISYLQSHMLNRTYNRYIHSWSPPKDSYRNFDLVIT